jgi:hypothetical protein
MSEQTYSELKLTGLALNGSAQTIPIPSCKHFSISARKSDGTAGTFEIWSDSLGTLKKMFVAGASYNSPPGDFKAQTLNVKGTNTDILEVLYWI